MPKKSSKLNPDGGTPTLTFEKVPHHGSEDSSDEPPLDVVNNTMEAPKDIPKQLEGVFNAFKMCGPRKPAPPAADAQTHTQGATFYAIVPIAAPRNDEFFKGQVTSFHTCAFGMSNIFNTILYHPGLCLPHHLHGSASMPRQGNSSL